MNMPPEQMRLNLAQTVIGRPLLDRIESAQSGDEPYDVIIEPNLDFSGGREGAAARIRELMGSAPMRVERAHPWIFATLSAAAIRRIAAADSGQRFNRAGRAIHRI